MFCKKGVLKNFENFIGKHLHWSLFSCQSCEFFKNIHLKNICKWLLLLKLTSAYATFFPCIVYFWRYVLVRSFAPLKSFLNRRFKFLICFKNDNSNFKAVIFSLSHTDTKIRKFHIKLMDTFFLHCLSPFSGFSFQSTPRSEDLFLSLRNTRFHNWFYMWILTSLKSTTRYHRYKFVSRIFLLLCV